MARRASISGRMYAAIKAEILAGAHHAGAHLDAKETAARLGASLTPVRAALYRLAGERLLEIHANDGFYLPSFSELGLRALYAWHLNLLIQAVQAPAAAMLQADPRITADIVDGQTPDFVEAMDRLFLRIGALAGSVELHWALISANERLRLARRMEAEFFADQESEYQTLSANLVRGDRERLEEGLVLHHRRRERIVPDLVLLLMHPGVTADSASLKPLAPSEG